MQALLTDYFIYYIYVIGWGRLYVSLPLPE